MRKIFFILLCFSFFACNETVENDSKVVKATVTTPQTKQPIIIKSDSIPPKRKTKNPLVMTDPARPKSEINTAYPFDIDLKTPDGRIINSSEILKKNGKPTVVLFWLTTCYPCRIEMAAIQKEIDTWRAETDFNIIAISTDFAKNYASFVRVVEKNNWSFDAYVDVNREFRKVMTGGLNGLPQTFIFDKNGKVVFYKRKYSTGDEHKLYAKIKEFAAM